MRAFVHHHPVAGYYALAIFFSWSYWLALLGREGQLDIGSAVSTLPGVLGPLCAAVVITLTNSGWLGVRQLLKNTLLPKRNWRTGLAFGLSPLLIGVVVFGALAAQGQPLPELQEFQHYPGAPDDLPLGWLLLLVFLVNGCGEEAGWRGFAFYHLQQSLGNFRATWVVSAMWLVWHAPLFWVHPNLHALLGPVFIGWALGLLCGAFVLSFVFIRSGASIFAVAVWHTTFNFVVATPPAVGTPAAMVSSIVMLWGVVVASYWWRTEAGRRADKHTSGS